MNYRYSKTFVICPSTSLSTSVFDLEIEKFGKYLQRNNMEKYSKYIQILN